MSLLLDSSVIIPLLLDYGERLLGIAVERQLYIIDLTIYEAGNGLWKLATLLRRIELRDAEEIIKVLKTLVERRVIKVITFNELDVEGVMELASRERITFYDASYIEASRRLDATLVTGDRELGEKAGRYVKVSTYDELRRELSTSK